MKDEQEFKTYIFHSASAQDLYFQLTNTNNREFQQQEFPVLSRLSLDDMDSLLERCWRKNYSIFDEDGKLDLITLEDFAEDYFDERN